jgi:HK97 family phage prohead protease
MRKLDVISRRAPLTATETKFARADLSAVEADGTFSGYASLFGKADLGRDMVLPGAFAASLQKRGGVGRVKMLFQHDPNQPIGVWEEIREDGRGLFVKGRLTAGVERAREVLSLMRAGALDGLSIGFRTVRGRTDPVSGIRRLIEVDLWEISVVTFPMLPEARVSTVKTARRDRREAGLVATIRQATRLLRRAAERGPQQQQFLSSPASPASARRGKGTQ